MSDDVKGVFVRLPLSEKQLNELFHAVMYCKEEAALLAIGTPVTGGELETEVVRVREHRKDIELPWTYHKAPPSDQDASEYELEVDRLLTHKQALAKLAEKDAEIARLNEELSGFREEEKLTDDEPYAWEHKQSRTLQYATPLYATEEGNKISPGYKPLYERPTNNVEKDVEITGMRKALTLFAEYEKLIDNGEDVRAMLVYAELREAVYAALKGGAA